LVIVTPEPAFILRKAVEKSGVQHAGYVRRIQLRNQFTDERMKEILEVIGEDVHPMEIGNLECSGVNQSVASASGVGCVMESSVVFGE
jgi:hypothetical protein